MTSEIKQHYRGLISKGIYQLYPGIIIKEKFYVDMNKVIIYDGECYHKKDNGKRGHELSYPELIAIKNDWIKKAIRHSPYWESAWCGGSYFGQ